MRAGPLPVNAALGLSGAEAGEAVGPYTNFCFICGVRT